MEICLNSKFFSDLSVVEFGEKTLALGYDGIDICVRPGHPINADNAIKTLPVAVQTWEKQGLTCPLATAAVDIIDPHEPVVENLFAACSEAGIPRLKIGIWRYNSGDQYWHVVKTARKALESFADYSRHYGVQTCYQTHSGPCIGSNCAGLMHLIKGFEPELVGAYPDLGHIALDGEDWAMGLEMVRNHLAVVGIKDALYQHQSNRQPPFNPRFVKVGDGCVDWQRCVNILADFAFEGPLTVHTEYNFDETIIRQVGYAGTTPSNLEEWAKSDAAYLRRLLATVS